jgi:hypothetical protein
MLISFPWHLRSGERIDMIIDIREWSVTYAVLFANDAVSLYCIDTLRGIHCFSKNKNPVRDLRTVKRMELSDLQDDHWILICESFSMDATENSLWTLKKLRNDFSSLGSWRKLRLRQGRSETRRGIGEAERRSRFVKKNAGFIILKTKSFDGFASGHKLGWLRRPPGEWFWECENAFKCVSKLSLYSQTDSQTAS